MNTLKNKMYHQYEYTSRYSGVPYYYDTLEDRSIYGIGSNMYKNTTWVAHKVTQTDSLDYLALKYYANPTLWWVIAYFNDIQDPFIHLGDSFDIIKIPAIASISFGNER